MALTYVADTGARSGRRRRSLPVRFLVDTGTVCATSPVVLGGPDDAPRLGAVTLETLGLMVNPLTRELLPMRLMLSGNTRSRRSPVAVPS